MMPPISSALKPTPLNPKLGNTQPETRKSENSEPGTRNSEPRKPENPVPGTRDSETRKIGTPEPGTRDSKHGTSEPKLLPLTPET